MAWLEWYSKTPVPDWVCAVRFTIDKEFVGVVEDGTKRETRRSTAGGYSRNNAWGRQFWRAYENRIWVRFMTGRANTTQFGWGLFTSMRYERLCDMPPSAPALEGRSDMSLGEFKDMRYFKGVGPDEELLVFSFLFAPLGPTLSPYPRPPDEVLTEMEAAASLVCCVCDGIEPRFAHACLTCGSNVHGIQRGCSVAVSPHHPDYDEENEMACVCKNCAEEPLVHEPCKCGAAADLSICDMCGDATCFGCSTNTPAGTVTGEDGSSGLVCSSCALEHKSETEVVQDFILYADICLLCMCACMSCPLRQTLRASRC